MNKARFWAILLSLVVVATGCTSPSNSPPVSDTKEPQPDPAQAQADIKQFQQLMDEQNYSGALAIAQKLTKEYPQTIPAGMGTVIDILQMVADGPASAEDVLSSRVYVSTDRFTGTTYYTHKIFDLIKTASFMAPQTDIHPTTFEPFIAVTNTIPVLCIEVDCTTGQGISANSIIVLGDGERFRKEGMDFSDRKFSSDLGNVTEKAHWAATEQDIKMLEKIASSSSTEIRVAGDHDSRDCKIRPSTRLATKDMLTAYVALGGRLPE